MYSGGLGTMCGDACKGYLNALYMLRIQALPFTPVCNASSPDFCCITFDFDASSSIGVASFIDFNYCTGEKWRRTEGVVAATAVVVVSTKKEMTWSACEMECYWERRKCSAWRRWREILSEATYHTRLSLYFFVEIVHIPHIRCKGKNSWRLKWHKFNESA